MLAEMGSGSGSGSGSGYGSGESFLFHESIMSTVECAFDRPITCNCTVTSSCLDSGCGCQCPASASGDPSQILVLWTFGAVTVHMKRPVVISHLLHEEALNSFSRVGPLRCQGRNVSGDVNSTALLTYHLKIDFNVSRLSTRTFVPTFCNAGWPQSSQIK